MGATPGSRAYVAERTGVGYRQLDRWTSLGHLKAERFGGRRWWSVEETEVARMMLRLVGVGLTVPAAAKVARRTIELATIENAKLVRHDQYYLSTMFKTDLGNGVEVLVQP